VWYKKSDPSVTVEWNDGLQASFDWKNPLLFRISTLDASIHFGDDSFLHKQIYRVPDLQRGASAGSKKRDAAFKYSGRY
jgi:hypothetical protein